jgi:hypothetical protein
MSGGILSGSGSGTFVSNSTRELAHALNCSQPTRVKKCLQQKNIEEIFDGIDKIVCEGGEFNFGFFFPISQLQSGSGANLLCNFQILPKSNGSPIVPVGSFGGNRKVAAKKDNARLHGTRFPCI